MRRIKIHKIRARKTRSEVRSPQAISSIRFSPRSHSTTLSALATIQKGYNVSRIWVATLAKKPFELTSELDAVIGNLRECGHAGKAEELRGIVHETAWTTSSEMLGEIGLCLLRIQQSLGRKPAAEVSKGLARCLKAVRKTWPDIKLR